MSSETITRNDLKAILDDALPTPLKVQTETVTSGNISLKLYKCNGVVQVSSFGNFPATNDGVTIVTMPNGFRPLESSDFTVFNSSGTRLGAIRFNSDGRVTPVFGNLTAGAVRACWTYICGF